MFEKPNSKRLFRQLGIRDDLAVLDHAWSAETGGLAGLAKIVAVDLGTLVIEVASSPAMQEITLRRKELLRRMNGYFKEPFLKDIRVRMI
jgi:hypothetical protein